MSTRDKPERDRSTEQEILDEAERGPTLPEGTPRPKSGVRSARELSTGAEADLTRPGNRPEDG
jgi:hypothetical protein